MRRRKYGVEYERLKKTGGLDNYRAEAPSPPMRRGCKILGFALVAIRLALPVMMVIGFRGNAAMRNQAGAGAAAWR